MSNFISFAMNLILFCLRNNKINLKEFSLQMEITFISDIVFQCWIFIIIKFCTIVQVSTNILYFSYVRLVDENTHQEKHCFSFWKKLMSEKYGSSMRWFDILSGQKSARKIKSYEFKIKIKETLYNTEHEDCYDSINLQFPRVFYLLWRMLKIKFNGVYLCQLSEK